MSKVYVFFAEGFEEIEALTVVDMLRRVNVDTVNNETDSIYRRPSREVIEAFERAAAATGATVTRRVERGAKSAAACGQLRAKAEEKRVK